MGVDYFSCDGCGEVICDCGTYYHCENHELDCEDKDYCERRFCSKECGGLKYDKKMMWDVCKFCRKETADDSTLLHFMLKKNKLTRKKAEKLYFESQKSKKRSSQP